MALLAVALQPPPSEGKYDKEPFLLLCLAEPMSCGWYFVGAVRIYSSVVDDATLVAAAAAAAAVDKNVGGQNCA